MKMGTIASPWYYDVGAYGTLSWSLPLARSTSGEIDRRIPNLGPQTLLRDAVLALVPVGDDILDERRGRHP
jgi:hypothetical protein